MGIPPQLEQIFTWQNEEYCFIRHESNGRVFARHLATSFRVSLPRDAYIPKRK